LPLIQVTTYTSYHLYELPPHPTIDIFNQNISH
jgi:hypothetical protein